MLEAAQLRERIADLDRSRDPNWLKSLSDRKKEESEYHDKSHSPEENASRDSGRANKKYYYTTAISEQYRADWIKASAAGKVFLDYACGTGLQVIEAAKAGAALAVGIDISPVSIEVAIKEAEAAGVSDRTVFIQGDCEDTGCPDNSFDAVLCSGVLHHMDLSYSLPELRRIMKPGGRLLAVEGMDCNPLIKMYRRLTPSLRTAWEKDHILTPKDLSFAKYFFDVENVKYWHFFSIMTSVIRKSRLFNVALSMANMADKLFLSVYPFSRLAWQFTFELVKPLDGDDQASASLSNSQDTNQ